MNPITYDQVTEHELHHFTIWASDLGLKPGQWPRELPTTMGNALPFVTYHVETSGGDVRWVDYRQANGIITLRVFND